MILYCPLPQAKVSPNFKSNYSETLAKLEHQYCKLLVSFSFKNCGFVFEVHPHPFQLIPLDHDGALILKADNYASALFLLLSSNAPFSLFLRLCPPLRLFLSFNIFVVLHIVFTLL